ncbi:MAG: TonB-dependent receptor plug domain-containing protein [Bryobacteraceae bacterium]|nr:TonB-dependent receptor plug domain-containing protein [Bryobacteraceae bacterium]MDW8378200.1 TonB-dependent receptor plug domain-containing protein [Bryobacterales bacterium]
MNLFFLLVVLAAGGLALRAEARTVELRGKVLDSTGAVIPLATVTARNLVSASEQFAETGGDGVFVFRELSAGVYEFTVSARGFGARRSTVRVSEQNAELVIRLDPADVVEEVRVSAGQIVAAPEELERLPGSVGFISASTLQESRVFTTDEALRKVSGVHTRGEEGFGLRPNIGIRGLNPTRSSRVLLLEDGVPLSYAPYGDNASYYHPPIDRFESVEVVKGAGQIVYGPMTVGGVINYVTPPVPDRRGGALTLLGGNRDYFNGHLQYGGNLGKTGLLFDVVRKQGEGARENLRHGLNDFNAKSITNLKTNQTLGVRFNYYSEDSNVAYSGLRQSEWDVNPRGNPFRNDYFYIDRFGASVNHTWAPSSNVFVSTNAYSSIFNRDWWRQSGNSAQRPNDADDPACGGMQNLNTTCGNEGRLRHYATWGVEPKVRVNHRWFSVASESDFGVRYHDELQERHQKNGPLPNSRDGVLVENNERHARAVSAFWQNRLLLGGLTITPGLRFEHVRYRRVNFLLNPPGGVRGATRLTQWIPGLGLAYSNRRVTFFTGLHRGFAPPRVEDVINNNTGASLELDPELSWNYEGGMRLRLARDSQWEVTYFRMNFSNQIIPASVAGGIGATLTNAGRTLHEGFEIGGRHSFRNIASSRHSVVLRTAYTFLGNAEFRGRRFSAVPGFSNVLITGNRLPYAPKNLLTASVSYWHSSGLNLMVENVYTDRQFSDDLNTRGGTPDGQQGLIPGNAIWNATLNYPVEQWRTNFFITTKNMLDRLVIVDRTRGLLPGIPRLVQFGIRIGF